MAAVEKLVLGDITFGVHGSGFVDVLNLWVLWTPPDVRGSHRLVPHRDGMVPKRRRVSASVRTLELLVSGSNDDEGTPWGDERIGLQENLEIIETEVVASRLVGDGTIQAELFMPNGDIRSGPVTVEAFDYVGEGNYDVRATLDLSLPDGSLYVGGS